MILLQDLHYAWRTLRASPGFSCVAIVTIALAIGANTAMFSFVNGTLLDPLPYPDSDRIVRVAEQLPDGGQSNVATLNYLDWVEQNTVFEKIAAWSYWGATLTGGQRPLRINAARVSAQYFDITGTTPALGRTFRRDEESAGSDNVVLLSHSLWESQFGSDPSVVGREIQLNGQAHTIVGVLPGSSSFDRGLAQLFKPMAFAASEMTRDFHWFNVFAKLAPGVSLEQARAEMEVIAKRIAEQYPDSKRGWSAQVERLEDAVIGTELRTAVLVLFAATSMVILIGCANLASLTLARGMSRAREIGVRASLGAGHWRLARQILTENVLLSVIGGVLGIGIGYVTLAWIQTLLPPFALPAEVEIGMDATVLLFALGLAVVTGLLFGMAPAVQATRVSLSGAMREGGRGTTPGAPGRRVRSTLVVAEMGLAFVLLVGAGLLMRSFFSLLEVDPGFDSSNVLTAEMPVSQDQYPNPEELLAYLSSIRAAVGALPGVRETAMTSALPLRGWGYGMPFQVSDQEIVDRANRKWGFFKMVTPSYVEALRIRLRAGRPLSDNDRAGSPPVMLVNETFARQEFANDDPVGKRVLVQTIVPGQLELGPDTSWEIVGVIADEKVNGLGAEAGPGMYVSIEQSPVYASNLIVRADGEPKNLEMAIRAAIASIDKDQPLSRIQTLEQIEEQSVISDRVQSTLLGIFATIALLLAALGIFGVISYSVAQRSHEMGIRAALGASSRDLRALVFYGGMKLVVIGLAVGIVGALAITRVMTTMLHGVGARDPGTIVGVAILLTLVAAIACFVPARAATRTDPNTALRNW